jgi:glucose-6-phosphate 1-dehydrogenase
MHTKKTNTTGREPLDVDLLLLGATGDLAARKIIPALFERFRMQELHKACCFVGLARQNLTSTEFIALIDYKVRPFLAQETSDELWQAFINRWKYIDISVLETKTKTEIETEIETEIKIEIKKEKEKENLKPIFNPIHTYLRENCVRVIYLATPPHLFIQLIQLLGQAQLFSNSTRIVLEKPLGSDAQSAQAINKAALNYLAEHQIYRIDHYLGKESVQNLLALRFGNILFEPLWRREWISDVQITLAEDLGVSGRTAYYDGVGALRDMVQNHLLQLLAIVAMEPPSRMDADSVRDEKLKVFKALKPMTPERVAQCVVRGQYSTGVIQGNNVSGYAQEEGVASTTKTETFVAIKAEIDNWRWAGVPFYLRTGKRLAHKTAEIIIRFKPLPTQLLPISQFNTGSLNHPNCLLIRLQPDELLNFSLMTKKPGDGMRLGAVNLSLDFDDAFSTRRMEAYERLLLDVMRGELTLFTRADELDAAWQWIDPIIQAWEHDDDEPKLYTAGTWGPAAANTLINRDGLLWHEQI